MATVHVARDLVEALLRDLDPQARLVAFEERPDKRDVELRIDTPSDPGKTVSMPKLAVIKALTDECFRNQVRNVLRGVLVVQRSNRILDTSRETLAQLDQDRPLPCPRCLRDIAPQESVRFEHGEVVHLRCPT